MKIPDDLIQKYFDVEPDNIGYCIESKVNTIVLSPRHSLLKDRFRIVISISSQNYLIRLDRYVHLKGVWETELTLVNKYWSSRFLKEEEMMQIILNELSPILEGFIFPP